MKNCFAFLLAMTCAATCAVSCGTSYAADKACDVGAKVCKVGTVADVAPAPATALPAAVQQAIDKLTADTQAYSLASGSLASAQAALAAAQNQLTALQSQAATFQAAIPQDQAAVTAAIANAFGPVVSVPVDAHPVQILEIASSTCGPCNALDKVIAAAQTAGVPVTRVDTDKDPTAAKWNVEVTPTFITVVGGVEATRYKGGLNQKQLVDWYADTKAWGKLKYPPKQ